MNSEVTAKYLLECRGNKNFKTRNNFSTHPVYELYHSTHEFQSQIPITDQII
jgi:hypothetical protein